MKNHSSLWSPNEAIKDRSQLKKFCKLLEKKNFLKHNVDFENLWKWSVKNPEIFWSEVWNFTKIFSFQNLNKIIQKIFYQKKMIKLP